MDYNIILVFIRRLTYYGKENFFHPTGTKPEKSLRGYNFFKAKLPQIWRYHPTG